MLAGSSWTQTISSAFGMLIERCLEFFFGPGIELLEEDDADGEVFALFALDAEIVSDLSGADEQAARIFDVVVGQHVLEVIESEVGDGGGCVGMAQHALGSEDDERLAPGAQCLTPQKMEVLRGVGGLADDHVLACGELQEALYAGGGVFGTLAVVAVGQEHDDAGEQAPLGFAGGDELVDDALRAVDEVAELGLPEDESFGVVARVAVLEAESGGFGEQRVVRPRIGLGSRSCERAG